MTEMLPCVVDECESTYADHKWGRINASKAGWFFQNSGESWCPEHVPEWVEAWREKAANKRTARPDPNATMLVSKCLNCGGKLTRPLGENRSWEHASALGQSCPKVLDPD
jgi:hypothetical protein